MRAAKVIVISIILSFFTLVNEAKSKVEAQNYDFSLDSLQLFFPGQNLAEIEKKYNKGELYRERKGLKLYKFYVAQIRYKFPVFVQVDEKGKVFGFFAKLPTYFLHDVYHQSLINRFGKQDVYKKDKNSAIYFWRNKDGNSIVYNGACTITCFPVYMSVFPAEYKKEGKDPLLKDFINVDLFRKL